MTMLPIDDALPDLIAAALKAGADAAEAVTSERASLSIGVRNGELLVFRGIPYGADTAPRRFQPALQEAPSIHREEAPTHPA